MRALNLQDPPEVLMQPVMLQRFLSFKAAEYTPGPIKRLATAALGPWWNSTAKESEQEAALRDLMGW